MSARGLKSQDSRKAIPSHYNASTVKCNRKGENPRRYQALEQSSESSTSWLCKNSACRAFMSGDDSFCRRCSCCICHRYDDIKDPTLWLVCAESSDPCGSSCHIECAFRHQKVGVVDPGQYMGLDGNYCCPSCGKVTGILQCYRDQLEKASFARWVDTLCYRLLLSYRLLDGTCKFKELLEVVKEAKDMLEAEVGPLDGGRDVIALGMVSRLPKQIHKLCFEAFEKCEQWLAVPSDAGGNSRVELLPASCKFFFQEVTSSSLFLILVEIPILLSEGIKGFKLWCWKSRTETYPEDPICTLSRKQTRMLIADLEPCTEYSFRVVSCAENGELCQLEAKCFTRRKLLVREPISSAAEKRENPSAEGSSSDIKSDSAIDPSVLRNSRPGFEMQDDLGNMLHLTRDQEQRSPDIANVKCSTLSQPTGPASEDNQSRPALRMLDLNVPDLNEDIMPAVEEDTAVGQDAAAASIRNHGNKIDGGRSLTFNCVAGGDACDVDSEALNVRKRAVSAIRPHGCNSTLLHGSSVGLSRQSGSLHENFEHWVKIVFNLERKGYITSGFRQRFLTWYSLGCTEEERRVANTFFENLQHDHRSLAAQILDSFDEIIPRKRQNYG